MKRNPWLRLGALIVLGGALAGCDRHASDRFQGYVEGEYVYVASPFGGQLETLSVKRGDWPKPGDPLFALECGLETAARDEAQRKLVQGRDNLEDAKKGKRPTELDSAEAQLKQARAALVMSEKEFKRQDDLYHRGVSSADDFDRALSTRDQDDHHVRQLEADLATAHLGSRDDQIAAAGGFVVLYPDVDAVDRANGGCWKGIWDPGAEGHDRGDAGAIAAMTRAVIARWRIDPSRVYAIGISAGGFETSMLGAAYPDLYAAIGIHSGAGYLAGEHGCPAGGSASSIGAAARAALAAMGSRAGVMPVIVFHGDRDGTIPYRCGQQALAAVGGHR